MTPPEKSNHDESNPYAAPAAPVEPPRGPSLGPGQRHVLATRWLRFVGRVLDNLFAFVCVVGGVVVVMLIGLVDPSEIDDPNAIPPADMALMLGPGLALAFIVQAFLLATKSQSIAKLVLQMRIHRVVDGTPAGPVRTILVREILVQLIAILPLVGPVFSLADAAFIFRGDRRCIHDLMAGTTVFKA